MAHTDSRDDSTVDRRLYKDNSLDNSDNTVRNRNTYIRKTKGEDSTAQPVDNSHTDTAGKASNSYRNSKDARKRYDEYTSVARNNLPILQHSLTLILPIPPPQRHLPFFLLPKFYYISDQNPKTRDSQLAYNTPQMRPLLKATVVRKSIATSFLLLLWIYP